MLSSRIFDEMDEGRLRKLLLALFVALAIPTAAVVWLAYDQLKWESWFQYRNQAEALVRQIDTAIAGGVISTQSHEFGDYAFITASDAESTGRRSPLAAYPVVQDIPGLIGYFQVDPDGFFSTPLLPASDADQQVDNLPRAELQGRRELAGQLQDILADNQLLAGRGQARPNLLRNVSPEPKAATGGIEYEAETLRSAAIEEDAAAIAEGSAQQAFDTLNAPASLRPARQAEGFDDTAEIAEEAESTTGSGSLGKLRDLRLDEDLEKRNQERGRRESEPAESPAEMSLDRATQAADMDGPAKEEIAITTFESETDPLQFSLLASGHMVLYRNAWRDGGRYIQGLLVDQEGFTANLIELPFNASTLAGMSDLVVGYRDDVIRVIRGGEYGGLSSSASELEGQLLYRRALSAPFNSVELVFAVNRMPAGPGASVLAWASFVIAVVFAGGFVAMYRLGVSQIRLARQQQDFVSAVSHE